MNWQGREKKKDNRTFPSCFFCFLFQPYPNMSTALSATLQQNSHSMLNCMLICLITNSTLDSNNNLTNSSAPNNLTPAECRQSEELNNQIMNCLR